MLEKRVHAELYNALVNNSWSYQGQPVTLSILRARQVVDEMQYPALFIDYGDAVLDGRNTPINEILKIGTVLAADGLEDIKYTKGVIVQQSVNLDLYDKDIRRISELQEQLFLFAKQLDLLDTTGVTIFQVNPPRVLDFTEENYIYRRLVEVICKFEVSWEEVVKTIEEVETTVNAQQ